MYIKVSKRKKKEQKRANGIYYEAALMGKCATSSLKSDFVSLKVALFLHGQITVIPYDEHKSCWEQVMFSILVSNLLEVLCSHQCFYLQPFLIVI